MAFCWQYMAEMTIFSMKLIVLIKNENLLQKAFGPKADPKNSHLPLYTVGEYKFRDQNLIVFITFHRK